MKAISFIIFNAILLFSCSQNPSGSSLNIKNDSFDFLPDFIAGSKPLKSVTSPPDISNFKVEYYNPGDKNAILLTWNVPKQYIGSKKGLGFIIYKKIPKDKDYLSNQQSGSFWDFSSDEEYFNKYGNPVLASEYCDKNGKCGVYDSLKTSPIIISYALKSTFDTSLSYNDIEYSKHAESTVAIPYVSDIVKIDENITEAVPNEFIGSFSQDVDRKPEPYMYNFSSTNFVKSYYLDPREGLDTESEKLQKINRYESMSASLDEKNYEFYIPDNGYYRGLRYKKYETNNCSKLSNIILYETCVAMLKLSPFSFDLIFGQKSYYFKNPISFVESNKDMDDSRKFNSRHFFSTTGKSGQKYLFVSDEQRVLIKVGDIKNCYEDVGIEKSSPNLSGDCGFDVSIGTKSPKQRCPLRYNSDPKNITFLTMDDKCEESDFNFSLQDSVTPTNKTLRLPGKVYLNGEDLYIPDSGNSRVVKISNFEEKIKSCGRLGGSCSYDAENACNSDLNCSWSIIDKKCNKKDFKYCEFDDVLGQYALSDSDDKFAIRSCIRGGEQNYSNYDDLNNIKLGPLKDPTDKNLKVGHNCLLDYAVYNESGKTFISKKVRVKNFEGELFSEVNPQTARLSELTQRMFRNPIGIDVDNQGRLFVLDIGDTIVKRNETNLISGIPSRVMVWDKNPFNYLKCPDNSPPSAEGGCDTLPDNSCVGPLCRSRSCEGIECNATFIAGQNSAVIGIKLPSEKLFNEFKPNELKDYIPIANMAVGKTEKMKGLWIVTGKDAKIYRYKNYTYSESPEIYNNKIYNPNDECVSESILVPKNCDNNFYKTGVFNAINLDEYNGGIYLWDSFYNVGFGWRAKK